MLGIGGEASCFQGLEPARKMSVGGVYGVKTGHEGGALQRLQNQEAGSEGPVWWMSFA